MLTEQRRMQIHRAITDSCIPLLCGDRTVAYRLASKLFRRYGIVSYVLSPKNDRPLSLLTRILSSPAVRRVPTACASPQFLAETAIAFFRSLDQNALPILIDCTENRVFLSDSSLRSLLEPYCTLTDAAHPDAVPPFCFLKEEVRP